MATRTLLKLRTSAKERSNLENSEFVSQSEWNDYINYSISELRDIIISKAGNDYFTAIEDYTLGNVTDTYVLPTNFYKLLWVELLCEDGQYRKIKRYEVTEKSSYSPLSTLDEIRYRLIGDNIVFVPAKGLGGRKVRLWFVPLAQEMATDADTLQGFNGWDEYIVLRAAIMALEKQEQDTSSLSVRLEQLKIRIEAMADNRDQAEPFRIQDTRSRTYWDYE